MEKKSITRKGWKQKGITFIDFIYSCWDYTCVVTFPYDVASLQNVPSPNIYGITLGGVLDWK